MNPRALLLLPLLSCMGRSPEEAPSASRQEKGGDDRAAMDEGWAGTGGAAPPPPASAPIGAMRGQGERAKKGTVELDGTADAEMARKPEEAPGDAGGGAPTRAWFPESFLWAPLVETGPSGTASVGLTVPDTLTTWRVLALAQSADGAQGGAAESWLSTLPAYVDVVSPSFLYAGDRFSLPVQVVNQGEGPVSGTLAVDAGASSFAGGVSVAAGDALAKMVPVATTAPGELRLRAAFADVDVVERVVPVRPSGRPVELRRGGTLAGPRELGLDGVPGGAGGRVEVVVYPGAQSVFAREVALAGSRTDLAQAAYAFALAREVKPLGGDLTDEALRDLSLLAQQRLTRATRAPDAHTAAVALAGLRGAPEDTLAGRLAVRLSDELLRAQQPDGLYGLPAGASLDEVLVGTARAVWALGPDVRSARLRAQGAFERHHLRLDTPAVAAWALAAGVVEGEAAEALRQQIAEAVTTAPDGTLRLAGAGTVSDAEATALACLVLTDPGMRADLAAGLLGRHGGWQGFGPGWTNLVALRAVREAMGGEIPASVTVRLTVDGAPAGEARLDPAAPWKPITLRGPAVEAPGPHRVELVADPPVPGLAFALSARTWVPWDQAAPSGLDVTVEPGPLAAGRAGTVTVTVVGPPGERADLDVGLPAGLTVSRDGLGPEVRVEDGAAHWSDISLEGGVWRTTLEVTPTLAGALQTGPTEVRVGAEAFTRVPATWTVRP